MDKIKSQKNINEFTLYVKNELGLSEETLRAYSYDVIEFINFVEHKKITAILIENFIHHLRKKGLVNISIRRKIMSIRCYCHFLVSIDHLGKDIHKMIDPIRIERKNLNAIESDDVEALISVVEKRSPASRAVNIRRDIAIILILYRSGLRVSELCNLDLKDIKRSRRDIRVMGKGCVERIVPTTKRCMKAICDYIDTDRSSNTNAVFVKLDGSRITRRSVGDMLKTISNAAGIKHVTPHLLRRSCATELMNRGVDLELIQLLLGHQNLSTTQSYLYISQDRLQRLHKSCHPFGEEHVTK